MKNFPYATPGITLDLYIKVAVSLKTDSRQYIKVRSKYLDYKSKYGPSLEEQILNMPAKTLQQFYKELKEIYVPI